MKKNKRLSPFVLFFFVWLGVTVMAFFLFSHFFSLETVPVLFLQHPATHLFFSLTVSTFFLFGLDKLQAHLSGLRVPEKMLYMATFLGGSIGTLSGMYLFRHKTRKTVFQVVVAFLIFIQLIVVYGILQRGNGS